MLGVLEMNDGQIPMIEQKTIPKGIGVAKFDFPKTFSNPIFSGVTFLYHQYLIANLHQKYLNVQNHEEHNE